ncbi:unnamed protein product [Rhodiola kirilowii]
MAFYKTSTVILLFLIVSCALTSSSVPNGPPLLGGWRPIKDVNDPTIQDLAKFALTEQNRLRGARLQFGRVIKGEQQVVAGMNYRLILAANSDGKPGKYEAVLYVRPWEKFRKLTSFRSV